VCSEKNLHGNWNAVRESTFTSPTACGVLATSGSLAGSWNDFWQAPTTTSSWDFCVDSTTYNSSYEFIGATTGKSGIAYAYGNLFANGLIGIGLYSENANVISSDNHAGVNIIALGSDGTFGTPSTRQLATNSPSNDASACPSMQQDNCLVTFGTCLPMTTTCWS